MKMLDEIHYRVVRGILGSNAQTQVQKVELEIDMGMPQGVQNQEQHPLMRQSQVS